MKIETREQALELIHKYYESIGRPAPKILDLQVIHSDSAIATIRFQPESQAKSFTHTIKVIGNCKPTLVQ